MRQIMRGEVTPAMVAAILTGLRVKKETVGEIAAAASVLREMVARVPYSGALSATGADAHLVDIVGTGGDGANTFNISTASMFVVAAAGARVRQARQPQRVVEFRQRRRARSARRRDRSAAAQVAQSIEETGIGFMFAPNHHPAMKVVAPIRREMGVRTLFNILGPLTNPAGATNILMGVFHADLVGIQVRVLQRLGAGHALVVWARDGMDEISLAGPTLVGELRDGMVREYEVEPEQFGLARADSALLRVDGPAQSKAMVLEALANTRRSGARHRRCSTPARRCMPPMSPHSIVAGVARAKAVLESGAARAKLDQFVERRQR